ncbi:MAG: class I SAM-dependent methyltransferase [Acidobacteriaceae bacterium]|nr:class I SAM-dependent methyltransferase [Acidobacteriaceae bacterium]
MFEQVIVKEEQSSKRLDLKSKVAAYWDEEPCDTRYASNPDRLLYFKELEEGRYISLPNIWGFARFDTARGLKVLEIGVGAGVDFCNWVRNGAIATGVDFTTQAIELTREYLELDGHPETSYRLLTADAEQLPFEDESFDVVYSYGVLHHTPDTPKAFQEARRVLRKGGHFKCMIYHSPSWVAINLWVYHALFKLRPWKSLKQVVFNHLESPGTKVYSVPEARQLMRQAGWKDCRVKLYLHDGDLLNIKLGPKYQNNFIVKTAQKLYPRWLIRALDKCKSGFGVVMHIDSVKEQ